MRIRNSYLPRTLSPLSPKRLRSDDQHTFARSPHVMVSRINGLSNKIESTSRTFDQEQDHKQEIVHEEEEEEEEEEMNVASANQNSFIGGWCEEEKAMPLKKRRTIMNSFGTDRGKMVKAVEDLMRCGRTDGKRWRCGMRRLEGYSMCEHHLLTRSARYRSEILKRKIDEKCDDEKKKKKREEGCFGNNNDNNKRKVKARSINSLVRDTLPLMPLHL